MRSLPLFHRIAGQPVLVLGDGAAAEPKRRLVERAGGDVFADMQDAIDCGARLAFVAHDDPARCEADAIRLRGAGLLVNVVDRPELCDFTTPSILDRDPVLIAVGTAGASAGLAKQLRLRLETLLPRDLGALALALEAARGRLRKILPGGAERRQALDAALGQGGVLDPMAAGAADRVDQWLDHPQAGFAPSMVELTIASDDPEDLTLRQARLLGSADVILHDAAIAPAILDRARADAMRRAMPQDIAQFEGLVLMLRRSAAA
ncbi:MAG: Siroheme synthase [Pseudomonadota bacterium]|jgi:uroporphyrin-III C-methyltransferase/precorrin-2 dehydrogenase/sirohydrochlorin ferrochelatase